MYALMFHAAKPQEAHSLFETGIHMVRSRSFAEEAMTKRRGSTRGRCFSDSSIYSAQSLE